MSRRSGAKARVVKGLHNGMFCAYGSWFRSFLRPPANNRFEKACKLLPPPPGGRMHRLLTALGRGFKERIGWKRVGIAASLLIVAFAITTLVRTFKGVDTGVILT